MSCICGIIRFDGSDVQTRDIDRMLATMRHRAPDRSGSWAEGPVGLGHGLMRVNLEDAYDAQPVHAADAGIIAIADLRLDNRDELAAALATGRNDNRPDSDLAAIAYQKWGTRCAEHLLGDFAIAVWDARKGTLWLARDHMGQRGIYYYHCADFFAFATEARGLLALADIPRELSEAAIAHHLVPLAERPAGATHLKDIWSLVGGQTLTIDRKGNLAPQTYWKPSPDPRHLGQSEAYYIAAYRSVLQEAVECRVRRLARPPALALSGGFDSAAIAGLAQRVLNSQNRRLLAVAAVGPAEGEDPKDPRPWVELCGRFIPGLDVHCLETTQTTILDNLTGSFFASDAPAAPMHYVDAMLYDAAAQAKARLFLDGMGGDYTLNHRGGGALAYLLRTGQIRSFLRETRAHCRMTSRSLLKTLVGDVLGNLAPRIVLDTVRFIRRGWRAPASELMIDEGFRARVEAKGLADLSIPIDLDAYRSRMRDESLAICNAVTMAPPSPRITMAAARGLDFSRPFHDRRVVELALAIPEELYVKGGRNRYLATRALADVYPAEFQTRDRRQTSGAPGFHPMIGRSRSALLAELDRLEERAGSDAFVNFAKIRKEVASGGAGAGHKLARAINATLLARFVDWFQKGNA